MGKKVTAVLLASMLLVGCETWHGGSKQATGTFIGGAAGAIIGAQFGHGSGQIIAAVIGSMVGAEAGAMIGKHLDEQDKRLAGETAYYGLERQKDYHVSSWHNPNTQHSGQFIVTQTTEDADNQVVCRDFVHMVTIEGEQSKVRGRACRSMADPNGEWVLQG